MTKSIITVFILFVAFNCFAGNGEEPTKSTKTQAKAASAKAYALSNLTPLEMDGEDNNVDVLLTQEEIESMNNLALKAKAFVKSNLIPLEMDAD